MDILDKKEEITTPKITAINSPNYIKLNALHQNEQFKNLKDELKYQSSESGSQSESEYSKNQKDSFKIGNTMLSNLNITNISAK